MDKKVLKESIKKQIQEELNQKQAVAGKLTNKWKSLLESSEYGAIKKSEHNALSIMLEAQHNYAVKEAKRTGMKALTESNISDNTSIQPYLKILVPTLRRSYKLMSAMELVGNQPLSAPQGYIYALRFMYAGDNTHVASKPSNLDRLVGTELDFRSYAMTFKMVAGGSFANILWDTTANGVSYVIRAGGTSAGAINTELDSKTLATIVSEGASTKVLGQVVYAESDSQDTNGANLTTDNNSRVLINRYVSSGVVSDMLTATEAITVAGGTSVWICNFDGASGLCTSKVNIEDIYAINNNEMGFDFIFKNYTGSMTTAEGEYMGSSDSGSLKYRTAKMTIERKNVETRERKLKIQYTDEMYEDLKNMHGLNAAEELTKMAEIEIANEINEMILKAIYATATSSNAWSYGRPGIINNTTTTSYTGVASGTVVADALSQTQKFETLATKIRHEANQIGKETRRAAGNFCVVSINVLTALQSTTMFSPAGGDDMLSSGLSYAGMLGKMKIYVDTYNMLSGDFCLVGLRGSNSQLDAGIIYSTYIPLTVKKAIDYTTMQEVIGFRTRCAITTTLFGANRYYRKFTVDLSGSMLGS